VRDREQLERCRQLVARCEERLGWPLSDVARDSYARALAPLLDGLDADLWETVAANYHADHTAVAALRDSGHPDHNRAWARWSSQALGMLRRQGLDWLRDGAVSAEDMAQIVLAELVRALPSYGYRSRFSTWTYSLVGRCAQRQVRAAGAKRRSAPVESLDAVDADAPPADPHARHEQAANARILAALVAQALAANPDRRLATIFQLWAIEDRTMAEIGAVVRLHESRVRFLLKQARELLRADPAILLWADRVGE
jgi:RNA polymerase sigma factor (sigma-70 family)